MPCLPLRWRRGAWRRDPSAARRRSRPRARSTRPRCAASGRRRCRTSCTAPWRSSSCSGTCRWAPGAGGQVKGGPPRATSGWRCRLYTPRLQHVPAPCPGRSQVQTPPPRLTSVPSPGSRPYTHCSQHVCPQFSQLVFVPRPGKPSGVDTPPYTQ